MKLSHLLISFLLATPARSSWPSTGSSSSTPEYENWSNYELYRYLEAHSVATRDYHSRKDLLDSVKFSWDPREKGHQDEHYASQYRSQDVYDKTLSSRDKHGSIDDQGVAKFNSVLEPLQQKGAHYAGVLKSYGCRKLKTVWYAWSGSDLNNWLVTNDIMSAEGDSQVKEWLIKQGCIKPDSVEEFLDTHASAKTWLAARIRAHLRAWNIDDTKIFGRPPILEELRVKYYQMKDKISGFGGDDTQNKGRAIN